MDSTHDPVADLILRGEAATVDEAEEIYLDRHLEVTPQDPVGVTLRSGDEIQVGTAALRVQIDSR